MATMSLGGWMGCWAVAEVLKTAAAARKNVRIRPPCAPAKAGAQAAAIAALGRWSRLPPSREHILAELRPQPFVDHAGVGLAGHRLHRLADEEAEQRLLAGLILLDLVGVGGEDLVDLGVARAGVAGLLEPPLLDDLRRRLAGLSMISNTCLAMVPLIVPSAT